MQDKNPEEDGTMAGRKPAIGVGIGMGMLVVGPGTMCREACSTLQGAAANLTTLMSVLPLLTGDLDVDDVLLDDILLVGDVRVRASVVVCLHSVFFSFSFSL